MNRGLWLETDITLCLGREEERWYRLTPATFVLDTLHVVCVLSRELLCRCMSESFVLEIHIFSGCGEGCCCNDLHHATFVSDIYALNKYCIFCSEYLLFMVRTLVPASHLTNQHHWIITLPLAQYNSFTHQHLGSRQLSVQENSTQVILLLLYVFP
jgi:hypothetical protein